MEKESWKVSLHGGHSSQFCEHAGSQLREMLEAAERFGYTVFGLTEHAPRVEERFLFREERRKGYDCDRLREEFEAYADMTSQMAREFEGRLTILRGFEAEIIPSDRYADLMLGFRRRYDFDYMVGSVHFVQDIQIDGYLEDFEKAVEAAGGLETLAVEYYQALSQMVVDLRPEVVGHLDLIRKNARGRSLETPRVREAARGALEVVKGCDAILDLNTAGYRKGLETPYPEPWLVALASQMEIPFCFGDDSHSVEEVGAGLEKGRDYLIQNGVEEIMILTRSGSQIVRRRVGIL